MIARRLIGSFIAVFLIVMALQPMVLGSESIVASDAHSGLIIPDTIPLVTLFGLFGAAVGGCIGGVLGAIGGAIPGILQILGTLPVGLLGCLCGGTISIPFTAPVGLCAACGSGGLWDVVVGFIVECLTTIGIVIVSVIEEIIISSTGVFVDPFGRTLFAVGDIAVRGYALIGGLAVGGPLAGALGVCIPLIGGAILCCLCATICIFCAVLSVIMGIIMGIICILAGLFCMLPCPCIGILMIIWGLVLVMVCGCIPLACVGLLITGGISSIITVCMSIPELDNILTPILSACAEMPVIGPILSSHGLVPTAGAVGAGAAVIEKPKKVTEPPELSGEAKSEWQEILDRALESTEEEQEILELESTEEEAIEESEEIGGEEPGTGHPSEIGG